MVCSIDSEFIAGVGKLQDRLIILLDIAKLFANHAQNDAAKAA
jgi:chemotaxis signal transduction protein